MKILVVTQYFYPENFRINDVCKQLVKEGHDVTVLTGLPNYPSGVIEKKYRWFKNRKEEYQGVKIIRASLFARRKNPISLLLNYISFMINGSIKALFMKGSFDVVYAYEVSPVTQIVPAIVAKKKHKVKLIVNCLDLWPESIKVMGIKEGTFIFKVVKRISSRIYKSADTIIIPSKRFDQYLVDNCEIKHANITYLPNHAEDDYLGFTDRSDDDSKIHLLFAGNIGKVQNMDIIVDAVILLDESLRSKLIVDIVGNGSYLEEMKKKVKDKQLDNIIVFHGQKPLKELKEHYEIASATLLTLENNGFISMTVPAKLQGYMAVGKPVLASISGSANEVICEAQCGLVCEANDVEAFAHIMQEYLEDVGKHKYLGINGKEYFKKHFTIDVHTKELVSILIGGNENV